ncbi:hypothetical protein LQ327_26950 [Actinomycetospora endophytica]|uniref:Uncharacterized protein n=1 Tax=Actinomycetospora endophytica TaxID=2291215 RepID=A0ABS8PHP2_9PSEU|nr:hypothetical protein [Actinomycetospora endophytica]MCD2197015.1 hypothetical protein [Actinomycetospora endophytica]
MNGITVVACGEDACPHAAVAPDGCDDELRAAIRETPHGMLVRTGCPRGGTCTAGEASAGPQLIAQPCDTARQPTGPALIVGPLHERADVAELCAWLRSGAPLPAPTHLVAGMLRAVGAPRAR